VCEIKSKKAVLNKFVSPALYNQERLFDKTHLHVWLLGYTKTNGEIVVFGHLTNILTLKVLIFSTSQSVSQTLAKHSKKMDCRRKSLSH